MRSLQDSFPLPAGLAGIGVLLIFLVFLAGCTQPAEAPPLPPPVTTTVPPTPEPTQPPSDVSVVKPDANHIIITYNGGPDRADLRQIDATVTDNRGRITTQHLGDSLGTTPVTSGSKMTFEGDFSGPCKVIVNGHRSDGSLRSMLETTI